MKKLVVLSVLLALMVMPAFASDVTLGGDLTYGFISDFSGEVTGFAESETALTLDLTAVVDEINTVKWSSDSFDTAFGGIDKAVIIHDLGAWLDLPVGVVLTVGYDDPDANEYQSISDYGNEEVFNFSPGEYWGFDLLVDADVVQFELAMDPGAVDLLDVGRLLIGVAAPDLMGVSAEAYYFQNLSAIDAYDLGQIGIDAAYSTEISGIALDAGVGFMIDMDDAAANGWAYGVGLAAAYDMFGLSLGIDGNETDTLNLLTGTVSVDPVELATIYVWFLMDLSDAADETFQSLELGVDAHVGAADMYVGYQITNGVTSADYNNAPGLLADGGFFVKWDINY
jgi:hypothetical protein